jgi:hypothetical protein
MTDARDAQNEWRQRIYQAFGVKVGDLEQLIASIAEHVPPPPDGLSGALIGQALLATAIAGQLGRLDDELTRSDKDAAELRAVASIMTKVDFSSDPDIPPDTSVELVRIPATVIWERLTRATGAGA